MVELLKKVNKILQNRFPRIMERWAYSVIPKAVVNINRDFTNSSQKRVLISYLSFISDEVYNVAHANWLHYYQMIHYFVTKGYCIDLCPCNDLDSAKKIIGFKYDVIIGFGKVFKRIIQVQNIPVRILFLTENNPVIAAEKYRERLSLFKQRHPNVIVKHDVKRDDCFDEEQLMIANFVIHMSSKYNAQTIKPYFDKVYTIEANAIVNRNFSFSESEMLSCINDSRYRFLWFGSNGFIHKGVDLLLDVMKDSPEYELDLYGISQSELSIFNALKSQNTHNCGRINVQTDDFINAVVKKHNFMVFPSCSEGMSTAVTTCMAHGIIPIVSKESGFDSNPFILILNDCSIDTIKATIKMAANMSSEEILRRRKGVYDFSQEHYTLDNFSVCFEGIMNEIDSI